MVFRKMLAIVDHMVWFCDCSPEFGYTTHYIELKHRYNKYRADRMFKWLRQEKNEEKLFRFWCGVYRDKKHSTKIQTKNNINEIIEKFKQEGIL